MHGLFIDIYRRGVTIFLEGDGSMDEHDQKYCTNCQRGKNKSKVGMTKKRSRTTNRLNRIEVR